MLALEILCRIRQGERLRSQTYYQASRQHCSASAASSSEEPAITIRPRLSIARLLMSCC
jgi:hypothetical protein